jgi:predicted nucleic acid-binding protein
VAAARTYLLDTNIVLHATRQDSPISSAVEAQFGLKQSGLRPAICEVTVAELWSFTLSQKWGDGRRQLLRAVLNGLVVLPISLPGVHQRWSEIYSHARSNGLAIQQDHNDIWILAVAGTSGLTLLSTDKAAFAPFRGTSWLDVIVLDARTGAVAG